MRSLRDSKPHVNMRQLSIQGTRIAIYENLVHILKMHSKMNWVATEWNNLQRIL